MRRDWLLGECLFEEVVLTVLSQLAQDIGPDSTIEFFNKRTLIRCRDHGQTLQHDGIQDFAVLELHPVPSLRNPLHTYIPELGPLRQAYAGFFAGCPRCAANMNPHSVSAIPSPYPTAPSTQSKAVSRAGWTFVTSPSDRFWERTYRPLLARSRLSSDSGTHPDPGILCLAHD